MIHNYHILDVQSHNEGSLAHYIKTINTLEIKQIMKYTHKKSFSLVSYIKEI